MTTLTIRTFEDLLNIVNTQPEWRHRLVKALFPEIDIAQAFRDLAESQKRMEALLAQHDQRLTQIEQAQRRMEMLLAQHDQRLGQIDAHLERIDARFEQVDKRFEQVDKRFEQVDGRFEQVDGRFEQVDGRFEQVDGRLSRLETDMRTVKHTVGELKGISLECEYRDKAAGIFGRYLRRGHDVTNDIAERLHDAVAAGQITVEELTQVLATDLLWAGRYQQTAELILVIEVSWLAETCDVERAVARATILRKLGLTVLPVVAAQEWSAVAQSLAQTQSLVITTDKRIADGSWQSAVTTWLEG